MTSGHPKRLVERERLAARSLKIGKKNKKQSKKYKNRNNFKVELRWLPLTKSTQIFLCDSVCVSSNRKSKIKNQKLKKKIENRKKKKMKKKNRGGL